MEESINILKDWQLNDTADIHRTDKPTQEKHLTDNPEKGKNSSDNPAEDKGQEDLLALAMSGRVLSSDRIKTYSPLTFAYIGDAVFELLVRTIIVTRGNTRASHYHHETISYVNAKAQADLARVILPELNEEERKIYRRGLNAKPATTAKNQSRQDYRKATALETLIGYLYLRGKNKRIISLLQRGFGIDQR